MLWLASSPAVSPEAATPPPAVAHEPLFADIVARAGRLRSEADAARAGGPLPADFARRIEELGALDMQAHRLLAARRTDGDLKCILKGISEDLGVKLKALEGTSGAGRAEALQDMVYLLNDNVEVITSPPRPPV